MKNNKRYLFVTYARIISAFSVIMVHLCQQSDISIVKASAQLFITGVTTFIILTGYLYGCNAKNDDYPNITPKFGGGGTLLTW